jgi:hypothetical protein
MRSFAVAVCGLALVLSCTVSFAGESSLGAVQPAVEPSTSSTPSVKTVPDQGTMGIGVKASMLGVGAEVATRISHRSNVRAGFNVIGYSRSFDKDGATYDGHLSIAHFRSALRLLPLGRVKVHRLGPRSTAPTDHG